MSQRCQPSPPSPWMGHLHPHLRHHHLYHLPHHHHHLHHLHHHHLLQCATMTARLTRWYMWQMQSIVSRSQLLRLLHGGGTTCQRICITKIDKTNLEDRGQSWHIEPLPPQKHWDDHHKATQKGWFCSDLALRVLLPLPASPTSWYQPGPLQSGRPPTQLQEPRGIMLSQQQ